MEFEEVLRRRKMTRRFLATPLPDTVLETVLRAATRAPSAGFVQGVDLLVLTTSASRERFWQIASDGEWRERQGSAATLVVAPVIIVPVADPDAYARRYSADDKASTLLYRREPEGWSTPYWLIDAAYATMLILMAATAHGLGSLFFQLHGGHEEIARELGIPDDHELIGAVALGYPAGDELPTSPSRRARRAFDEVIHKEEW
jgi:nitroreductase